MTAEMKQCLIKCVDLFLWDLNVHRTSGKKQTNKVWRAYFMAEWSWHQLCHRKGYVIAIWLCLLANESCPRKTLGSLSFVGFCQNKQNVLWVDFLEECWENSYSVWKVRIALRKNLKICFAISHLEECDRVPFRILNHIFWAFTTILSITIQRVPYRLRFRTLFRVTRPAKS